MIPEEYKTLISKIESKSKSLKKIWEETSDGNKYILKIGANSITLHEYEAFPSGKEYISLEIINLFGEKVDGIYIAEDDPDFSRMSNLFTAAKRNSTEFKKTLDNIIKDIDLYL